MGVIGTYPLQRVSEPQAEGQIACACGPTCRRPYTGSFCRSSPGVGVEELGLIRALVIHRDLFCVERPVIGDDRCVVLPWGTGSGRSQSLCGYLHAEAASGVV